MEENFKNKLNSEHFTGNERNRNAFIFTLSTNYTAKTTMADIVKKIEENLKKGDFVLIQQKNLISFLIYPSYKKTGRPDGLIVFTQANSTAPTSEDNPIQVTLYTSHFPPLYGNKSRWSPQKDYIVRSVELALDYPENIKKVSFTRDDFNEMVKWGDTVVTKNVSASNNAIKHSNTTNIAVGMNVNKNAVPEKNVEMSGQENVKPKENVKPNENDFNMLGGTKKRSKSKSKRRHTKKHRKTKRRA